MSVGIQRLRDDADAIRVGATNKGEDASLVDAALAVDEQRRHLLGEVDGMRAERKQVSEQVGATLKAGGDAAPLKARSVEIGARIDAGEEQLHGLEDQLEDLLLRIPNPPDPDVPVGPPDATITVRDWGTPLMHDAGGWERRPHWEIGERLGILDLPAGAKVTGTGFPVFRGAGARLERTLINLFMDMHADEDGMTEIWPPAVINADSARGTGQIPDKEDQMYVVTRDELYLNPTAEVAVTNLHRDEIIEAARLPIHYVAYSPSFRREAGAAGRATRGILRVHQFDKVEMVAFTRAVEVGRHAGVADALRRTGAAASRAGLSGAAAVDRRHGLHAGQDIRPRGLGTRSGGVARGLLGIQLPRLPGAAHEHSLAARARRKTGGAQHPQRVRAGPAAHRWPRCSRPTSKRDGSVALPETLAARVGPFG